MKISDCCSAEPVGTSEDIGICPSCKEHCEYIEPEECDYNCDEEGLYEANIDGADVMCACPNHYNQINQPKKESKEPNDEIYVIEKRSSGDATFFWALNGMGYTANIKNAQEFTEAEAKAVTSSPFSDKIAHKKSDFT